MSGESAIGTIPEERWSKDTLQHPVRGEAGRSVTFAAGILEEADLFDAPFFNISPREAAWMDPQQRLLLEMAHEAMEDAGLPDSSFKGSGCGVFIGISGMDYGQNALNDLASMTAHTMTGNTLSIAANRISYVFDLHGPSLAIDTACSSSLAAVHQACQALRNGEAPMALAGGINMLMHPYPFIGFSQASMLSASGQCRPFDASCDGYVRGEGGGLLLLKPLAAALAEGNHIHAVIIASGINADGAGKKGLTIPSALAQTELMSRVLEKSGLDADDLAYVEAHGTGTPVGDPIEAESLGRAYGSRRSRPLPISSAKANFGHLEPASGMAGLLKAILVLKHRQIPPMPFAFTPNPDIDFKNLNLFCAAEGLQLTSREDVPLTGAVNSFGFGGLNAHVLLRAALPQENNSDPSQKNDLSAMPPLVISARSRQSLEDLAGRYADLLESLPEEKLAAVAWNAAFRRTHMEKRLAVLSDNPKSCAEILRDFSQGLAPATLASETALPGEARICFVYNGNGAQWRGMGCQLYEESPAFARILTELDRKMEKITGWSILETLLDAPEASFEDTSISQPLLFAIQVALTSLFKEMGIRPFATCGHSVGEVAAAWAAGQLSLEEAIRVLHARSTAQGKTRGLGSMAAVGLGAKEAAEELDRLGLSSKIEIAAANSPHNCTLSGDGEALELLGASLAGKSVFFRLLALDYAFHSSHMDSARECLEEMLAGLSPTSTPHALFISTVDPGAVPAGALDASYWWRNMRQPVDFSGAIGAMIGQGVNIFVEIGPHAILQRYIRENLPASAQARVMPSMQQSNAGLERIRLTAASLHLLDPASAISLYPDQAEWLKLPSYPWEHQKFSFPKTVERRPFPKKSGPLLGWPLPGSNPVWEIVLDPLKERWLQDHQVGQSIVFPAAAYIEMVLEAAEQWRKGQDIALENFDILLPLLFEDGKAQTMRCEINSQDGSFIIQSRPRLENGQWLTHASGRVISRARDAGHAAAKACPRSAITMAGSELYARTASLGLDYGPFFRRVLSLSVDGNRIEAHLREEADGGFVLDPGALDACFHTLAAIYATKDASEAYLPVGFRSLKIFPGGPASFLQASLEKSSRRTIHAAFTLFDAQGKPVAHISDCRFRKMPSGAAIAPVDAWYYKSVLKPLPALHSPEEDLPQLALEVLDKHEERHDRRLWLQEILPRLEAATVAGISALFAKPGNDPGNVFPAPFISWLKGLRDLAPAADEADVPDWREIWLEAHNLDPASLPALLPPARILERLSTMAKEEAFGEPAMESACIINENSAANPAYAGIDALLANFIETFISRRKKKAFHILEAAAYAEESLRNLADREEPGRIRYERHFPDTGRDAPSQGEWKSQGPATNPLEKLRPREDGQGADIVIVRHLLHRSEDLKESLRTISASLAPGGLLLIAERHPDWSADLASGMREDWWRSGADNQILSSRMKPESWLAILEKEGFEACGFLAEPEAEGLEAGAYLLYARKKNSPAQHSAAPFASRLVFFDEAGHSLALLLAEELRRQGLEAFVEAWSSEPVETASTTVYIMGKKLAPETLPDLLASMNSRIIQNGALDKAWIVTWGAVPGSRSQGAKIDPLQCAIAGFARVARMEKPSLDLRLRDLSPELDAEEAVLALAGEIIADSGDDEACLSSKGRHVLSLAKGQPDEDRKAARARLDIVQPGRLDRLAWIGEKAKALGDDEVEAQVMATGLNFRDIMLAMGLLPEDALENGFAGPNPGLEFSGIVTAVGGKVKNFAPGDRIAGFAPACFATHVRMPENSITHIPQGMAFSAAAAIPTIFITAWYALKHLAQLQKGERLLIHGGAGGVGLAAIQIGRLLGAEIFATAGTEEKRAYLRLLGVRHVLDSRSLDFADEILELTGGQGVDVVLNSLAGEAMRRSLSLLRPFGRFLELGKRDYVENTSIGLRPFKENVSYFSIDVDQLLTARPELASALFEEVMTLLGNGDLLPPPVKVFAVDNIEDAFRTMQQARHIGKIVVDMQKSPSIVPADSESMPDYSGSWLVSGGTAGFGLETARHLAQRGVRHLVLASRQGDNIPGAEELKQEFRALGAEVCLKACDFTKADEVSGLIDWIRLHFPPLTGLVHAAAVFDDRRLEDMDREAFGRSINPKLLGALNLHQATLGLPLKHFILFSSISVALGNPGQGNYVAANAALEGLTIWRNSLNLPASCLAWGPIGDSGYLSRNEAVRKNLSMQLGRPPLSGNEAMAAFDRYAAINGTHVLANINWRRALEFSASIPVRLAEVYSNEADEVSDQVSDDFAASLLALGQEEALEKLRQTITSETAKVLGMTSTMVPPDRNLQSLGLDSLMAMELALGIEQITGLRLPPMLLQDAPTIDQLARRIWERLGKKAGETDDSEALLLELARRHSEELEADEIEHVLESIKSDKR